MLSFRQPVADEATTVVSIQRKRWPAVFVTLWLFIILVSVIDGYLVLQFRNHITELNPQGRALIALNSGKVWYLLGAKYLGTVVACAVLLLVHHRRPRMGITVAAVLAALQLGLLLFLVFG